MLPSFGNPSRSLPIYATIAGPPAAFVDGNYVEVFDFGAIITGALVNVTWSAQQFDSSLVAISCTIAASDDNITFTSPVSGTSAFFTSCRYARVILTFTPADDHAIVAISYLYCSVDIKYAVDSGSVTAVSTDIGGTTVNFNKAFKDVNSITLTVAATEPITAVYDFIDTPNPTSFKVLAYDADGARITYLVSWMARGIV
jgi:hypothetical protein